MILLLGVLAFFCGTTAAEDVVEGVEATNCNCTQLLHAEEAFTEPTPTFPATSFTCWGRYDGYYADIEVDCTMFHYCQTWHFPTGLNETVKWDFACPESTIFNQKILSCTPPNNSFDCQESPNYYWVNYNLTSASTTTQNPPPVPPLVSTSVPSLGQQLIVGGPSLQSSALSEDLTPNTNSEESGSGSGDHPIEAAATTGSDTPNEVAPITGSDTPNEAAANTGSDTPNEVAEVAAITGSETSNETPSNTGSDPHNEVAPITGSEPHNEAPTNTGNDTPNEVAPITGSDIPNEAAAITGSDPHNEVAPITGSQTPNEAPMTTGNDTPNEAASITGSNTPNEAPATTGNDPIHFPL